MTESNLVFEKGTLFVAPGGGGAPTPLPPGINGQALVVNLDTELGLEWDDAIPGSGDVDGPASATDNALCRYDGATGKLIKNSVGVLSDGGALSGLTALEVAGASTLIGALNFKSISVAIDYQVLATDMEINVTDTSIARTITLPLAPADGSLVIVKDASLAAGTNNITIDGNGKNILAATSAATYVIDSNGGAAILQYGGVSWSLLTVGSGGGSSISLSPYIIGPSASDFADFQDAIDAAVLAGYNASNPINIYVKPSNATYVNAFTGADGVNLIGLGYAYNTGLVAGDSNTARVYAPYTHPDAAICTISGLSFYGQNLEQQGGTIFFENCNFFANARLFFTGVTEKNVSLNQCYAAEAGALYATDGSVQVININENECVSNKLGDSTFDADVIINYTKTNGFFSDTYVFLGDSSVVKVINCVDTKLSGRLNPFNFNGATNCTFTASNYSTINAFGDFVGVAFLTLDNCKGDWINTAVGPGIQYGVGRITNVVNGGGTFDTFIDIGFRVGFSASNPENGQAYLSTADDTPTQILQVEMLDGVSITLSGRINASSADHTDICGGDFMIVCNRPTGGPGVVVGTADINPKSTSTADFDVTVDNTNPALSYVFVTVTGLAATAYNWALSYEKIRMTDEN